MKGELTLPSRPSDLRQLLPEPRRRGEPDPRSRLELRVEPVHCSHGAAPATRGRGALEGRLAAALGHPDRCRGPRGRLGAHLQGSRPEAPSCQAIPRMAVSGSRRAAPARHLPGCRLHPSAAPHRTLEGAGSQRGRRPEGARASLVGGGGAGADLHDHRAPSPAEDPGPARRDPGTPAGGADPAAPRAEGSALGALCPWPASS